LTVSIQWSNEEDNNNISEAIATIIHNEKYYISSKISELPDSFISIPANSFDLNKGISKDIDRSVTVDLLSIITTTFPVSE
jgi:predicted AlkP superfamily phosphohydrolase/phosphomutase